MRLGRLFILAAIVLVVGLGLVFVLSRMLGSPGSAEPTPEVILQKVVVLAQPVSRGEILTAEKLTAFDFPQERIPPTVFTDISTVAGKIARFDMGAGTFLTESMVLDDPGQLDTNTGSDHSLLIPPGMVAFPLPISRFSSVAWGLERGDRVNVIVTLLFVDIDTQFQSLLPNWTSAIVPPGQTVVTGGGGGLIGDPNSLNAMLVSAGESGVAGRAELDTVINQAFYLIPSEQQRGRAVSQTVLQNVVVLQLGTFPQAAPPTPAAQQVDGAGQPVEAPAPVADPPDIVTLIVSPQDAVTLNYLIYAGAEITLALRSASDTSTSPTQAVTLQFLLDTYQIPVPARLPYGLTPRLDVLEAPILENDEVPAP